MREKSVSRRAFLKEAGGSVGLSVAYATVGRASEG